ncbi:MAG: Clp protease N-terminal domain-containing protein [Verrucomicrobiota bacterium]|jgi:ATP-dependent Clp protease ATP-binding subunit ClpA
MSWFKSFWKKLTGPTAPGAATFLDETIVNFTPRAQQAMVLARKEADRLHHHFVGTEHVLLGLIKLQRDVAINVLEKMGLDLEIVCREIEKQAGPVSQSAATANLPYTPRVKKVLALAVKEARALNHTYVGTEHILLGLLREGDGMAARVLKQLHVDLKQTRQDILKELDPKFIPGGSEQEIKPSELLQAEVLLSAHGNFTPRARQVLGLAQAEADRFHHSCVSTGHLLLGLIKLGRGVAANVLKHKGLNLETTRAEVEKLTGTDSEPEAKGTKSHTPRAKNVLSLASQEAKVLNHTYVGTEHILLGLLREGDGVAARVLKQFKVDLKQTRKEILKELDPNFMPGDSQPEA